MSASYDTRPDPGGETATSDRNPSVDEILKVYRALERFAISRDRSGDHVHEQEDDILPRFTDLADALRTIRSRFDRFEGWPDRVERDLRRLCDLFDETVRRWDWEKFAAPAPERAGTINERQLWFGENRERPYYESAISAEAAFDGTEVEGKIRAIADEGRKLGYGPSKAAANMTEAELRALYYDASEALRRRPYLSDVRPEIGEQYDEYVKAWTRLRVALRPVVPAEIDPTNNTPSPIPEPLETRPAQPTALSPAPSVTTLKERGFERFTVKKMHDDWEIGVDSLEEMAQRAVENDRIHPDYKIIKPKKQTQLLARRKR